MSAPTYENATLEPDEDGPTAHELLVNAEVRALRVKADARDQLTAERAGAVPPFDAGTLAEVLARPREPAHRVEGLIPADASTLIVAMRKTGKTTLLLNLARGLLNGGDFLGRFPVVPVTGTVALLNYEVSAAQLARWAHEVGVPQDRLVLVNLRGRRNPLGNAADREALATLLRSHDVESVICDPFGRAFTGTSQNDSGEVGAFLASLDRWARGDVGAKDVVLAAHAGWDGERTRGSSALEDWADSIVTLVRDKDDEQVRFLRAEGRDVLVDEDRLDFDTATRALTLAGAGSRKAAAKTRNLDDLVPDVVRAVAAAPGITGYKLGPALREQGSVFQRGDELKAVRTAVERGLLTVEAGARNAKVYRPAPTSPDIPPPTPAGDVPTYPHLLYREVGGGGGGQQLHLPRSGSLPGSPHADPRGSVRTLCHEAGVSVSLTRITDRHGADWPVTGAWCVACGMPLAVDAPGRVHPGCQPAEPDLTDAEHVELVALLVRTLGAHSPDPMALGTWRRTGRPVVAA